MPKSDAKNNEKNLFIAETICFAYHLLSLKKQNISYLILIQKKKIYSKSMYCQLILNFILLTANAS